MSFNIGLSGIRAASTDLEVTGNNVANASTTGFKQSRTEFADLYTQQLLGTGGRAVGSGVLVDNIHQQFNQGTISSTDSALDMAIDGNGFFVLSDQGATTYTRSGIFSLDRDGYVVANSGARLQGFSANETGVVDGVMDDIQIQVTNQPPRLTTLATAILNLNAGAQILQEEGLTIDSNGLSVGAADAGIPESTTTILNPAGQPRTEGNPAELAFAGGAGNTVADVGTAGTAGGETMDVDLGDGLGAQTITLTAIAAGSTEAETLTSIQQDIDAALGSQQLTAIVGSSGELILQRAGYSATDGSSYNASATAPWDALFGAAGSVVAGDQGELLFVGSDALTADFTSVPGTQTVNRTLSAPPLSIVESDPGEFAVLTADNSYGNLDLGNANGYNLAFTVASEAGDTYSLQLSEGTWVGAAATDFTSVTIDEVVAEINAQITNAVGVGNEQVVAVNNGGLVEFQGQAPAVRGDYIQLGDDSGNSVNFDLTDLGFQDDNHFDGGVEPVEANNEFDLEVTSTTGNAGGPYTITIPPASYATLDDLAEAIQNEIDNYVGASGIADKVTVEAVGGQLVFTNTEVGAGEGLTFSASAAEPQALAALGFDNLFTVTGENTIDRSNSFRVNLVVPAPDTEGRSGSVLISLNEEYRSVQQLAASINRQLNSQDAEGYIGVQAMAVEIEPRVSPPQYQLQFQATQDGEASVISVTSISAEGPDVTEGEMYALLQADPYDDSLLETGIEGVTNEYPETTVTLVDPEGNEIEILIPEDSEANEIVALFNQQPGVTANAETEVTLPLSGYNSPGDDMFVTINGQRLESTSLEDMAEEINSYRGSTLPGFLAEVNDAGDLIITNQIGRDIQVSIDSNTTSDSLVVQGKEGTGPVLLGGSSTADTAARVGGNINFILNEGYIMQDPDPVVSGIFGTLDESEYETYILNSFDPDDQDTYNHATSTTVYDSLGNDHIMTQYFVKEPVDPTRPDGDSIWVMYVQIDGEDVGDPDPSLDFPENLEPSQARYELFFNQDGTLDEDATGDLFVTNWDPLDENGERNGAMGSVNVLEGGLPLSDPPSNSNFQIDMGGTTQFGSVFSVNEVNQDGYAAGRLTGLEVDGDGVIFARFTNGQAQTLGQVSLAYFRDPEGLSPVGNTAWAESFESGVPTIGAPGTGSFGNIRSSALEDSNVDISEELVGLIIAQRNFQASAKTIETTDQVTQTILNL